MPSNVKVLTIKFIVWTSVLATSVASSLSVMMFLPALPTLWSYLFNADALFLPALWEHLFVQNGSWTSWYPSVVGFYFPDMIVAFFSHVISDRPDYAVYVFFTLQQLMLGLAFSVFLRGKNSDRLSSAVTALAPAILASLIFIHLNLVEMNVIDPGASVFVLGPLMVSAHHTGTIFSTLLSFYLFLRWEREQKGFWLFSWILLSIVAVASDKLYVVSALGPVLAYGALKVFFKKMIAARFLKTVLLSILAAVMGHQLWILIGWWHRPAGVSVKFATMTEIVRSFEGLLHDGRLFFDYEWLCISMPVVLGLYLLTLNFLRWIKEKDSDSQFDAGVLVFFGVALPLLATVFKGLYSDLTTFRYLESLVVLPIFWTWGWIVRRQSRRFLTTALLTVLALAISTQYMSYSRYGKEISAGHYPPIAACLDALPEVHDGSLQYGYADYWNTKPIRILSKKTLRVAQLSNDAKDVHWISSDHWSTEVNSAVASGSKFFVVTTRLDNAAIEKRFGSPQRQATCSAEQVSIFNTRSR